MSIAILLIAGFLSGFIGALGLGGGGVLVIFLTAFLGLSQLKSQGINLLFFIPVGLFALIWHIKKKLVKWRLALPAIGAGLLGAAGGSYLAMLFGNGVTGKIFGSLLLVLGIHEIFRHAPPKSNHVRRS